MSGDDRQGIGGIFEMLVPPVLFGTISLVALMYFKDQLVIDPEWLPPIFFITIGFGFVTGLLLKLHFEYGESPAVLLPLLLFYTMPVTAWFLSDDWVPFAENDSAIRFAGILTSGLFAYFSVYSILFLGIETLFSNLSIDINKSPLRWLLPGFGIEVDDDTKAKSFLVIPAAVSLFFSITICYYLIDLEYPYSLFAYSLRDSNSLADIMSFTVDETFRSWPIGDIWEIWNLNQASVDVEPDNQVFQIVRTVTNIALSLAFALGFIFLTRSSERRDG